MIRDSASVAAAPPTGDPIVESIRALALFAQRASGADGYVVLEFDSNGALTTRHESGLAIPRWGDPTTPRQLFHEDDVSVVAYSMGMEDAHAGQLAFAFRGRAIQPEKLGILDRMAALIEAVRKTHHATARLVSKIGSLDAELAAIKIAERTQGLLANGAPDTSARHVETVLQGRQAGGVLEELVRHLEDRVDERKLLVRAKALLQHTHGMSEEQAYLQLRVRSRASRKRLRVVAQELIVAGSARGWIKEKEI